MPAKVAKARLSWKQKLNRSSDLPKVVPIRPKRGHDAADGTMAVPSPLEIDAIMKSVPSGKLITTQEIRTIIAERHGATIACPLTTGIFAWIAAYASAELAEADPRCEVTPYWRTLKAGGLLNEKYPGGVESQRARLESEGHTIARKGKRFFVLGYDRSLVLVDTNRDE